MSTPIAPMPHIVTGRYGIGPISSSRLNNRMSLMRAASTFQAVKDMALDCLKRGDRDGARFYGQQARHDWNTIKHLIHA